MLQVRKYRFVEASSLQQEYPFSGPSASRFPWRLSRQAHRSRPPAQEQDSAPIPQFFSSCSPSFVQYVLRVVLSLFSAEISTEFSISFLSPFPRPAAPAFSRRHCAGETGFFRQYRLQLQRPTHGPLYRFLPFALVSCSCLFIQHFLMHEYLRRFSPVRCFSRKGSKASQPRSRLRGMRVYNFQDNVVLPSNVAISTGMMFRCQVTSRCHRPFSRMAPDA